MPPQDRHSIKNSYLESLLKLLTRKRFSERVDKLINLMNMLNMKQVLRHLIVHKVKINFNMLHVGMKYGIGTKIGSTNIVKVNIWGHKQGKLME